MSDLGLKLKTWKYDLKKSSFDTSLSVNDIVTNQQDPRVDKNQFKKLVISWFDEKNQVFNAHLYSKKFVC